ncbi:hypothetical protein N7509_005073 [Penicillium cosmopolitanum]|uniref:Uncharacterized protein n=1 Tax=Penicillium cosmopolitanum TaxID=1131564 RepID=A0A9X0B9Q9_9EURO|nr:uncharacterized protein N7509_005073 [Penicillium cosmopolitanum]KAJ5396960.1 hypothetical protein N7509_005073 [Penicillium cosmopolitanum]
MNFTQVRVQARFQAPGTSQPRLLCLRPTEFTLSSAAFTLRTDIAPIVHGVTVALALGPSKKIFGISKRIPVDLDLKAPWQSLFPSRLVRNGVSALVQGGQDAVGM